MWKLSEQVALGSGCMDSVDWNGGMEWWNGLDWTGMEWNGMSGCNFVIKFCGRDQTLTRVHRPWPCPLATIHQCNVTLRVMPKDQQFT